MKKFILILGLLYTSIFAYGQPEAPKTIKKIETTSVKYQANTNTCWSYSTTSMIESECLRKTGATFDLSEMFIARNLFIEKAKRYIKSEGKTLFEAGGLGHDALYGIINYGAIPEEFYPSDLAIMNSDKSKEQLEDILKVYLQNCLLQKPVAPDWSDHFIVILDSALGTPPKRFFYQGKEYTPIIFANDVLKIRMEDYITLTSFVHHPYYENFALEIPDNYLLSGNYYNVPVSELVRQTRNAISGGYSVVADMDVTNNGWNCRKFGFALYLKERPVSLKNGDIKEEPASQQVRQELFESKATNDDHLIHLVGLAESKKGKKFFILKDSGGKNYGPFEGFDYVSENYFIINTLSILLPKAALSAELLKLMEDGAK